MTPADRGVAVTCLTGAEEGKHVRQVEEGRRVDRRRAARAGSAPLASKTVTNSADCRNTGVDVDNVIRVV